jgi:hypothetical protein
MVNAFCADELKHKPGLLARSFGLGRGSPYYAGRQDMAQLISNLIADSQRSEIGPP